MHQSFSPSFWGKNIFGNISLLRLGKNINIGHSWQRDPNFPYNLSMKTPYIAQLPFSNFVQPPPKLHATALFVTLFLWLKGLLLHI